MPEIRVAVVGCGAVAETAHLPALSVVPDTRVVALVDIELPRARAVAERFRIPRVTADHREVIGEIDAALVAVPPHLHAPITIDLLRGGVHVLVEKPMALNRRECEAMIDAAETAKRLLAVGLLRRFHDSLQFVKAALSADCLGTLTSVEIREGSIYRWKAASPAMFRPPVGGVLADIGVHLLDLLLWWFGDCQVVSYRDDARGGVEANCELSVRLPNGIDAYVELSRTRQLPCTAVFVGSRGTIEVGTKTDSMVRLLPAGAHAVLSGKPAAAGSTSPSTLVDLCIRQLADFADAIRTGRDALITGRDGLKSVALVETCYALRQPLSYPWEAPLATEGPILIHT